MNKRLLHRNDKQTDTSVIWQGGKPDKDGWNWLCPKCLSRPPASATKLIDKKNYCIYCGALLNFESQTKDMKNINKSN